MKVALTSDGMGKTVMIGKLKLTPELAVVAVLMVLSALSVVFIGALVAPPKILMGRSLTAIPPNLFPLIVLSLLAVLCASYLFWRSRNADVGEVGGFNFQGWDRGAALFGLMLLYALTMEPFGFLISSAMSLALISWLAGNRTIWQVIALSLIGPPTLYLLATRVLAVSLPELSTIEFAYSRLLGG
jgi:putative tricarboxylic transport membrane protein